MFDWLLYPAPREPVPQAPAPYRDLELTSADGTRTSAWLAARTDASASTPLFLFLHGNGENLGTLAGSSFLGFLWRTPGDVLVIDYPGYGKSSGRPSEHSLVAAASAALAFLAERARGRPLVVIGWSLGAAVCTQAVSRAHSREGALRGMVLVSPWSSLLDVAAVHAPRSLARLLLRDRYETEREIANIRVPTLVIHGRHDALIPVTQGERVAASAPSLSRLVIAERAQHNDVLEQPETRAALAEFIAEHSR